MRLYRHGRPLAHDDAHERLYDRINELERKLANHHHKGEKVVVREVLFE